MRFKERIAALVMLLQFGLLATALAQASITYSIVLTAASVLLLILLLRQQEQVACPINHDMHLVPDAILLVNQQGRICYANPAAETLLQCKQAELKGRVVEDFVPEHIKKHHKNLRNMFLNSSEREQVRALVTLMNHHNQRVDCELFLSRQEINHEVFAVASLRTTEQHQQLAQQLKEMEKRFLDTFDSVAIGMAHVSLGGHFVRVNKALCEFLGYPSEELLTMSFQEVTHPDDLDTDLKRVNRLLNGEITSYKLEKRYRHREGHYLWARLSVSLIRDELNHPQYFVSAIENIAERKQAEALLHQSERKFRTMLESLSDDTVVWMTSPDRKRVLYVNPGFFKVFGRNANTLYTGPLSYQELVHSEDISKLQQVVHDPASTDWGVDYRINREDGQLRFIRETCFAVYDEYGELNCLVHTALDRTHDKMVQNLLDDSLKQLKRAYEELANSAERDGLTNVLNRSAIVKRIENEFLYHQRSGHPSCLVFIDLDRFKQLNDRYGHGVGDKALELLAGHLRDNLRQTDEIGRYGGDEFILLLRNTEIAEAKLFVNRLALEQLSLTELTGDQLKLGLSLGLSELGPHIKSVEHWINHADELMYQHKEIGRQDLTR